MKITPVDSAKEIEGVEVDYYGVKLKVARSNNKQFVKHFRKATDDLRKPAGQTITNEEFEEATMFAMSRSILVGWSNFFMDGEEIEYSHDNALKLLKGDHDVREFISNFANRIDNFMIDKEDELLGE